MATNKRKDSAALFELIDKSTLKVPKNSGSLKIPSWWSSKNNPPTAGPALGTQPAKNPPPAPRAAAPVTPAVPAIPATPAAPVASVRTVEAPKTPTAPGVGSGAPKQVFAPATMGRQTAEAISAGGGASSGPPVKMLVIAACGLAAVALLAVYMVHASHNRDTGTNTTQSGLGNGGGNVPPLGAAGSQLGGADPTNGGVTRPYAGATQTALEPGPHRGIVYTGAQVQWNKDLFYIVIASYPNTKSGEDLARKAAEFIADHGVDVVKSSNNWTKGLLLISYQGFPTARDAEAERLKIVDIGKLHPDAKKKGGTSVWYDSYALRIVPK